MTCIPTVYPKKYAHGFCFAVLCCGYTLTDFPISTRLTSLALWQSNHCPSASKATLMNMDKYFMWNHYERLHNHNKAKHNKTVCIFIGIYCIFVWDASLTLSHSYAYHGASEVTRRDKGQTHNSVKNTTKHQQCAYFLERRTVFLINLSRPGSYKWSIIGSDYGLLSVRRQIIISTKAGLLLTELRC